MAPKQKGSVDGGKNGLPSLVSNPPMLQRKSSSVSILDIGGTALNKAEDQKNTAFPKLERKSGSLQDVRASNDGKHVKRSKTQTKRRDKKPKDGWSKTDSLPSVPKLSGSHGDSKPTSANSQARSQRRRAGDILLTRPATIAVVVKYQLGQHELKKFKSCFRQIDLDSSGVIDYDEFFEFIDETKTPFSEGLFRMIDSDSNGTIDYEEFVHATVLYCMYTRDEILHFAFDTFDPAATGSIGDKELRRLISMVNDGQSKYSGNINNALAEFDRNKDGVIDFEEFKNMNKRFPMLLFPCFRLQDRMQKATLGDSHWLSLHRRLYERLKKENYQRKHNGALPALTLVGAIVKLLRLDHRDVYQP